MARWWLRFGSECRGLSDVGQLRFSNGSDLCGMMLHDVSCGSDWCPGVGSVMAKSCVVTDYVVQFEIQIRVQIVVAQVYMVQLWFRVGVTSMWFRCVCPCVVPVYMWFSLW